ncbi:CSC1-like protein RXW8 isoform X3 [Vigna angularis]|uniref:CSC1-like protein RXW8 isoform X3 n=1 Tax=Phaseolus angularis TaxID=3914 RepID=UPI0022B5334A|nr:CSC1-like protein RXW8 isoform X3 [Vigna angularis]
MDINALLISAGINIVLCVVLFSFYSVLRKQPSNVNVYFGRRLASQHSRRVDLCLERFVPSPSWILKAWETSEEEILAIGGLDAVVFVRMLVFSIRVFSIAAVICLALVLPINYHGRDRTHKHIPFESLEVFTIENVKEGSTWLWAHCLALYIITFSACTLLYIEYKSITNLRLLNIVGSPPNPSHFTILVRSVPWSSEESYCETVKKFFSHYHSSAYLSHQMIYKSGKVQKLKECAAAFVFFKSRYAALMAAKVLQTPNPMLWVTDLAPEPHDIYWSNICVPYRQLWIRKIATLVASIAFVFVFLIPVTFVQGLTQLDKLQKMFPFLRGLFKEKIVNQVVTGYLPSVILVLFLCAVPPMMMLFSSVEGSISRSARKKSACCKFLYFTIWNVFFVNVFTGSVISQLSVFTSVTDLPAQLAKAVPSQATFFTTYVLSSGWASLACEVMQIFPLLCNIFQRFILRLKEDALDSSISFPYHTEVPRVLLFGFLGFTCSILAPLMLPFLLFYFFLAYLVYRNQIINVYITKYDSGGQFWPIAHNTTVFSLIFSQLIAMGVFGLKRSTVASGFTIPLLIGTLLFHQYCRQRFLPIFKSNSAQIVIDMDMRDEHSGRMEEIYEHLPLAYSQPSLMEDASSQPQCDKRHEDMDRGQSSSEDMEKGKELFKKDRPRPVQRSVSLNSDKSVLGLNL